MNPPLNAARAVSFGTFGRFPFIAVPTLGFDVAGPASLRAGGKSLFPVAALILARASGVRNAKTDFPGSGVSPSISPLSFGSS